MAFTLGNMALLFAVSRPAMAREASPLPQYGNLKAAAACQYHGAFAGPA